MSTPHWSPTNASWGILGARISGSNFENAELADFLAFGEAWLL